MADLNFINKNVNILKNKVLFPGTGGGGGGGGGGVGGERIFDL